MRWEFAACHNDDEIVRAGVTTARVAAVAMSPAQWKKALLQSLDKNSSVPFCKVCIASIHTSKRDHYEGERPQGKITFLLQFFQLATVRPDGRPANRTVVYRGFQDNSEKILFTTHTRYGP